MSENDESGGNDVGYEDVDVRTGDEILRSLGIPSPTMVYCPANDALLQVTDRSAPVGLCYQLDSQTNFYLTKWWGGASQTKYKWGYPKQYNAG